MRSCTRASRATALRAGALIGLVLASAAPGRAESAVSRLATSFVEAVAGVASGRAVELEAIQDRTLTALGRDLAGLIADRLAQRVRLAHEGERLLLQPVLSQSPGRLWLSARVVEEPGSRSLDVLTVSVDHDADLPEPSARPGPPARAVVELVASVRMPAVPGPVLALAFVADDRVVALSPDALALYRLEPQRLGPVARRRLPGPRTTVRAHSGLLLASEAEGSLWALTNTSPRAVLYGVDGADLAERTQADALPWPGSPAGLRYRVGTNLIEGHVAGLGSGPFLVVAEASGPLAVLPDGRLRLANPDPVAPLQVGSAVAGIGPGLLAVSSARPAGTDDAVLVVEPAGPQVLETLAVDGTIRALASRQRGDTVRLVAAVEGARATHLQVLDLRRRP